MAFTLFFFTAWLTVTLFTIMKKKLSMPDHTFVLLIILVISINWSWVIGEELKFIKITEKPIDYTAFLLFRSITLPMIVLLQLEFFHRSPTFRKWVVTAVCSIAVLFFINLLSLYFDISQYKKWNVGYDVIYFILLHVIALFSHRLLRKIASSEVNVS